MKPVVSLNFSFQPSFQDSTKESFTSKMKKKYMPTKYWWMLRKALKDKLKYKPFKEQLWNQR